MKLPTEDGCPPDGRSPHCSSRTRVRHVRRLRDDAQHLGGGSLLLRRLDKALTRMGDLPSACSELLFEIGAALASPTNAHFRTGQIKLATSRSALRLFASQGHLLRWSSQAGT